MPEIDMAAIDTMTKKRITVDRNRSGNRNTAPTAIFLKQPKN
jgi:hypothetical protein